VKYENSETEELALEGGQVKLTCYRIHNSYFAAVESGFSRAMIACATGSTREEAHREALEIAKRRLLRAHRVDPTLTVGG
jgi:hypothetical protein